MSNSILQEAEALTQGARQSAYGNALEAYTRITGAFNAITGHNLSPQEGIMFMIFLKLDREKHKPARDNRVDGAGYFAVLDMAMEKLLQGKSRPVDTQTQNNNIQ